MSLMKTINIDGMYYYSVLRITSFKQHVLTTHLF